jgi:hypothetical protein
MARKRASKNEPESYAGRPQATPMPQYRIPDTAAPAMPMPTPMPAQGAPATASSQRLITETMRVIAMDDYPAGRGGMRMVPTPRVEQSAQRAVPQGAAIGNRPPARAMPTSP